MFLTFRVFLLSFAQGYLSNRPILLPHSAALTSHSFFDHVHLSLNHLYMSFPPSPLILYPMPLLHVFAPYSFFAMLPNSSHPLLPLLFLNCPSDDDVITLLLPLLMYLPLPLVLQPLHLSILLTCSTHSSDFSTLLHLSLVSASGSSGSSAPSIFAFCKHDLVPLTGCSAYSTHLSSAPTRSSFPVHSFILSSFSSNLFLPHLYLLPTLRLLLPFSLPLSLAYLLHIYYNNSFKKIIPPFVLICLSVTCSTTSFDFPLVLFTHSFMLSIF